MSTPLFYILDHLPKVPEKYIDYALELVARQSIPDTVEEHNTGQNPIFERVFNKEGKLQLGRTNPRYNLEEVMAEWVNSNITTEWCHIGVSNNIYFKKSKYCDGPVTFQGPHTDLTRHYTMMYLLLKDNDDQETVFWREVGKPLRRKRDTVQPGYEGLTKIGSIVIPLHTWVYFDTTVLHSVENIHGSRVAIHIGSDCDTMGVFMKEKSYE